MPQLSERQAQVVERVARGLPDKVIAHELGITIDTVRHHIQAVAARVPGNTPPRHRLTGLAHQLGLYFFNVADDQ